MILIASGSLRGSIDPAGLIKLIKSLTNVNLELLSDLFQLLQDTATNRYDRDFCDLVFRRVQA